MELQITEAAEAVDLDTNKHGQWRPVHVLTDPDHESARSIDCISKTESHIRSVKPQFERLSQMSKLIRQFLVVLLFTFAAPGVAVACILFVQPDPDHWARHATIIVDATVERVSQKPLTSPKNPAPSPAGPMTWVLTLTVHGTLRGEPSNTRKVATRFSNTTILDQENIARLVGQRQEFALVGFTGDTPSAFSDVFEFPPTSMLLPPHDGYHVWNSRGEPLDEIWEGLCTALPIFELGTFSQ